MGFVLFFFSDGSYIVLNFCLVPFVLLFLFLFLRSRHDQRGLEQPLPSVQNPAGKLLSPLGRKCHLHKSSSSASGNMFTPLVHNLLEVGEASY